MIKWAMIIKILVLTSTIHATNDVNLVWSKTYGDTEIDNAYGFILTADSGVLITGQAGFGDGLGMVWLLRTDKMGDTVWTHKYIHNTYDFGISVISKNTGYTIFAGSTDDYTSEFGFINLEIRLGGNTMVITLSKKQTR